MTQLSKPDTATLLAKVQKAAHIGRDMDHVVLEVIMNGDEYEALLDALAPIPAQTEKVPTARPVAFRVPRVIDDKISKSEFRLFDDEDEARRAACDIGADYDGLYLVADRRAAFFAQPDPAQSKPEPVGYVFPDYIYTHRRREYENNGVVMYARPQGTSSMPLYAEPPVPPQDSAALKPSEDQIMKLIRKHFDPKYVKMLTHTSWKDGIDIDKPAYAITAFAESIAALANQSQEENAGERQDGT